MRLPLLVALLCLAAWRPAAAEEVLWLTIESPPAYIITGRLAGQGVADQNLSFLQQHLPDYTHRVLAVSSNRLWDMLAHTKNSCALGLIHSPLHDEAAIFSKRPMVVAAYRFVIKRSRLADFAPYVSADGAVDLKKLAANAALSGVYVNLRAYPGTIADFIDDPDRKSRLEKITSAGQTLGILNGGRADFSFLVGNEIRYYQEEAAIPYNFIGLPIDGVPASTELHIGCARSPLGQKVIAQIDMLLSRPDMWDAYLQPLKRWADRNELAVLPGGKR